MATKWTANPLTKIITITEAPVDGIVAFDIKKDLYSDGKSDWRTDSTLFKYSFPISVTGGDDLPGSKSLGSTFFIAPPWKIRPYEGDHRFAVNGNFYSSDGESPFIPTLGNYNVFLEQTVSSLVDSTVQQLDAIEYGEFNGGISYDETNGYAGTGETLNGINIGTPRAPSDNVLDARSIAQTRGFTLGYLVGDMNLPEYEEDGITPFEIAWFTFQGSGKDRTVITTPAIAEVYSCTYLDAKVTGYLDGDNTLNGCLVENLDYIKGYVEQCVLSDVGEITLGGSDTASILGCFSAEGGAIINLGGTGQPLLVGGHNGSLTLKNKNGNETARIGLNDGELRLDMTTILNGLVKVTGIGKCVDDATGEHIASGMYNGGELQIINDAISQDTMSSSILGTLLTSYQEEDTVGWIFSKLAYGDKVYVDANSANIGEEYPIGLSDHPVNNVEDAIILMQKYGCKEMHVHSDLNFLNTHVLHGYHIVGHDRSVTITADSPETGNCEFKDIKLTGTLNGRASFYGCELNDVSGLAGVLEECSLIGDIHLYNATANQTIMYQCHSIDMTGPIIYVGSEALIATGFSGSITINDLTTGIVGIGGDFCRVALDASCTGGIVAIGTKGTIVDNSTGTFIGLKNELTNTALAETVLNTVSS